MTISLPDWYPGGCPDAELVALDLLQPFLDLAIPAGLAVTSLPDNYSALIDAGGWFVRIHRVGGSADAGTMRDSATLQIAVITGTRVESWRLMEFCRQILLSYLRGGAVRREDDSTTLVDSIDEMVGPAQIPELNPDKRLVWLTFRLVTRKPRGLPDYQRVRESLNL